MSRYIRTKNFIVELENWMKIDNDILIIGGVTYKIVKQADNIKELCDEFVGVDSQGHYLIHNDEWLEGARIVPLEKVNYYGAMWTEWGLKYVSKMKSMLTNGEIDWELL